MIVRPATVDDIPEIVRMGQEFVSAPGYRDRLEIEPGTFAARLDKALASPDAAIFVLESGDALLGGIGGLAAQSMFTSKMNAIELFWFVRPIARELRQGRALLDALTDWAKSKDCLSLTMIEPPDAPEVGRAYERRGFTKFETYWILPCR